MHTAALFQISSVFHFVQRYYRSLVSFLLLPSEVHRNFILKFIPKFNNFLRLWLFWDEIVLKVHYNRALWIVLREFYWKAGNGYKSMYWFNPMLVDKTTIVWSKSGQFFCYKIYLKYAIHFDISWTLFRLCSRSWLRDSLRIKS